MIEVLVHFLEIAVLMAFLVTVWAIVEEAIIGPPRDDDEADEKGGYE